MTPSGGVQARTNHPDTEFRRPPGSPHSGPQTPPQDPPQARGGCASTPSPYRCSGRPEGAWTPAIKPTCSMCSSPVVEHVEQVATNKNARRSWGWSRQGPSLPVAEWQSICRPRRLVSLRPCSRRALRRGPLPTTLWPEPGLRASAAVRQPNHRRAGHSRPPRTHRADHPDPQSGRGATWGAWTSCSSPGRTPSGPG